MTTAEPIEVRDMAIVHRTFRNAFQESAQLVRANPTPSPARVTFLADHVDFSISMLHRHHESEDELLFPLLVSRVPEQATNTEQVQREHELVATAIDNVTAASTAWRGRPSPETGESLASALDHLNQTLQAHLDDEERDIVPLAAVTLTQAEWDAVGEHSRAGIPRNKMPLAFGLLTEPLNEADRAFMKSHLPPPIRLLYGVLIQRPWNKYAATLRTGT